MLGNIIQKVVLKIKIEWKFLKKKFNKTVIVNECINKNYIKQFLPNNSIIIDAGAHVGGDSIEMCRIYKGSTVHAFEPVPHVFRVLKHNTRKYKAIHCHQVALSNHNGHQLMHVSSGASDGSSSLLAPKEHLHDHPDVFFNTTISVQTQTLDEWANSQQILNVDLLWLDLQGFELEVLKSSRTLFQTVKVIHMEVSTKPTYENVPLYKEVRKWMDQQGFRVEVEAIPPGWDMGNVLFVRN